MTRTSQPSYSIGRSPGRCAVTGRHLAPGEPYVAALVEREAGEGFERLEYTEEAWEGGARPERLFGYWRAIVPEPNTPPKLFVDDEALLELFDTLGEETEGDSPDRDKLALRFVLTLILLRKRLLKHVGQRHREDVREMLVRRKGEPAEAPPLAVIDPGLHVSEVESIAAQLEPVLRGDS
jgi:hypothetical protein